MRFVSTAGRTPPTSFQAALFQGLAPDGGLFMPEALVPLPGEVIEGLRGADAITSGLTIARHMLGDEIEEDMLRGAVDAALGFPIPLVPLGPRTHVLELFHGPTLAFKDVGARFMAHLMSRLHREPRPLTVMVATSGDTGGAVARAFLGLPSTRVVVLFPEGRVSPRQERQFTTLQQNVLAVSVAGTFDDCQRMVKAAFGDPELRDGLLLTSANSINIGRLLPQILYYFHAWAQLPAPESVVFSVPSGNFGNLTAGLMAKELGLEVDAFVAATNANNVVPEYLRTGRFAPRPSVRTTSNAMDVGNPSNFARIAALYGDDVSRVRSHVVGSFWDDDDTRKAIARTFEDHGYVLDPHTAVATLALQEELRQRPRSNGVVLATAHPAKFNETVEAAIGQLIPIPEGLVEALDREPRVERIEPHLEALRRVVLEWGGE